MSSSPPAPALALTPTIATNSGGGEKSYFEQQRAHLRSEISMALEQVLMNMNTLNRNMESIVAVGREFESVEALWSQFEGVMGKNPDLAAAAAATGKERDEGGDGEDEDGDQMMG